MLECAEQLVMALQVMLKLEGHPDLNQVILNAERPLVEMTIRDFGMEWVVTRDLNGFTTVTRKVASGRK